MRAEVSGGIDMGGWYGGKVTFPKCRHGREFLAEPCEACRTEDEVARVAHARAVGEPAQRINDRIAERRHWFDACAFCSPPDGSEARHADDCPWEVFLLESADPLEELANLIRETGARMTFDSQRDITKPCFRCARADVPRKLVVVGRWTMNVYGGMRAGDAITRPMCAACVAATPSESKGEGA